MVTLRHEVIAILKRVEMRNSAIPIDPPTVHESAGYVTISVCFHVPDRAGGHKEKFYTTCSLDIENLCESLREEVVLREYRELLREIFTHEFKEAFHFDGVRVYDPHVALGEKYDGSRIVGVHRGQSRLLLTPKTLKLEDGREVQWP